MTGSACCWQVRRKRGDRPDRAEQVDVDDRLAVARWAGSWRFSGCMMPAIVISDVDVVAGGDVVERGGDRGRVGDVEEDAFELVLGGELVEEVLAAAADDDGVAEVAEAAGELEADTRRTAGEEDRVACGFHGSSLEAGCRRQPGSVEPLLGKQWITAGPARTLESWSTPTCPISCASAGRPCSPKTSGCPAADGVVRRDCGARRSPSLASMSTDYYSRLEGGRGPQPSVEMLGAIARALRLTLEERDHLFVLAGHGVPPRTTRRRPCGSRACCGSWTGCRTPRPCWSTGAVRRSRRHRHMSRSPVS